MNKQKTKSYFSVEISTGAINGFYAIKDDAIESSDELANRWKGSKWMVAETLGYSGNERRRCNGGFHQDKEMQEKLKSLFVDTYERKNTND